MAAHRLWHGSRKKFTTQLRPRDQTASWSSEFPVSRGTQAEYGHHHRTVKEINLSRRDWE